MFLLRQEVEEGRRREEGERIVWQLLQNCRQGESHTYTHTRAGVFLQSFIIFQRAKWEKGGSGLAWRCPISRLKGVVKQKRTSFGQADPKG